MLPDERPPRRPDFAEGFPPDPELDALVDAFARGDYARVRAGAAKLARSSPEEGVRRSSRTLLERTNADPLAIWLLVLAGALLVALSAYWIVHGRPPRAEPHASTTSDAVSSRARSSRAAT